MQLQFLQQHSAVSPLLPSHDFSKATRPQGVTVTVIPTIEAMPPPSSNITEEDWEMMKPHIEIEYLHNNRPAHIVRQYCLARFNLDVSVRKFKLKFEQWNWPKKIKASDYVAMNRVVQELGQHVVFIVPKLGGHQSASLDAKKIIKEIGRKRTTIEKQGRPPLPILDIQDAYQVLHDAGIRIERHPSNIHIQLRLAPNPPTDDDDDHDGYVDSDDEDEDDAASTTSDDSMPDADIVQDSSQELNRQNFPVESHFRQRHEASHITSESGPRGMPPVLPFAAAYLADLHCNIFPHTVDYKLASPTIVIVHQHEENVGIVSDPEFLPHDYTDYLDLNSNPELPASQRAFREKLIAQSLVDHYRQYDHDDHRKMVLEFSAYYVSQVLVGDETLDDYNQVDRSDARNKLRTMLEQNNMQLLSHCYWISSMIISYDRIRQLLAFYEDCIDCIDTSTSHLASVLRPWIHFMVLSNRQHYSHYAAQSSRLSPAALEHMARNFNASQSLEESMKSLKRRGYEDSHTHLILRLYHAWNRCHQEDPKGGLIELIDCLPLAERRFGLQHLVTINCMSMVAGAYEKLNDRAMAKATIDIALSRFKRCSKMLVARFYQMQLSSAQLRLTEGRLLEARDKLERVVSFRQQSLGVQAPATWDAAEMLFDTMSRLGLGPEAQQRRAELRARYEEDWRRHAVDLISR